MYTEIGHLENRKCFSRMKISNNLQQQQQQCKSPTPRRTAGKKLREKSTKNSREKKSLEVKTYVERRKMILNAAAALNRS